MKTYKAEGTWRHHHPVLVYVDGELSGQLRHHVHHSPDGYAWGYGGSGPSELAKDLLWDVLGEQPEPAMYQDFKARVIANIPQGSGWELTEQHIRDWIETWQRQTI